MFISLDTKYIYSLCITFL